MESVLQTVVIKLFKTLSYDGLRFGHLGQCGVLRVLKKVLILVELLLKRLLQFGDHVRIVLRGELVNAIWL